MSTNCCVKSCKSFWTPITHLSFFRLPIHKENLKNKWLKVGPGYRSFTKNARICSDHFLPEDYKILSGKRILNRNAVPSVFNNKQINSTKNVPEVGFICKQGCASSTENNKFYQALDLSRKKYKCDIGAQVPLHDSEAEDVEMGRKQFRSVFVQTESRILGPSPEVIALRHENKLLKDRLRKKEKRISNIIDLVQQLKDGACLGYVHEDERLKRKRVAVKEARVKKKVRIENVPQQSASGGGGGQRD